MNKLSYSSPDVMCLCIMTKEILAASDGATISSLELSEMEME